MRRYPPSTIHRYLDLPYTQIIQTHNSHRHNTTSPDPCPSHYPLPHSPPTPLTPPQPKHRHTSNSHHVPTRLVKPKPNPIIHSTHHPPPTPPRAKHIHISHTPPNPHIPRTTLIHNTSDALDTMPEPRVPPTCPALTTPHPFPIPALPSTSHHHTLSADTHATQTTVNASQSQQPPHPHMDPRQLHRQTKNDNMTTDTHIPSSKSQINLIILQVNIHGIKTNWRSSNCLFTTHMQISSQWLQRHSLHVTITIQETKLIPKTHTTKVHNFTTVRAYRLHKVGGELITLIRDITFTTADVPSIINTHNTELQMVKVHINNTKHITIANIYIPPRDSTSTHYKTADTDIQHYIQYITNIPHSVLTGDVKHTPLSGTRTLMTTEDN